jgi:hypothetical protein
MSSHAIRIAKIQTLTTPNAGKDMEQQETHSLLVEMQNGTATLYTVWQFLTKLNKLLPHDLAIALLDNIQIK